MTTLSPLSTCEEWLAPTADTTTATLGPQFLKDVRELSLYVCWSERAVGGVVVVEAAHSEGYTGRWALVLRVAGTSGGYEEWRAVTGVHAALRVRVVDPPIGGDVSVWVVGN